MVDDDNDGFFSIGIWHPKTYQNVGTLWRSSYQLGACEIFTIGDRFEHKKSCKSLRQQTSDTSKAWTKIPYRKYFSVEDLIDHLPHSTPLIAIEIGGRHLTDVIKHPKRACYLLGAEDHGISPDVLSKCHDVYTLPSVTTESFNVSVAGAIVMYDRLIKG